MESEPYGTPKPIRLALLMPINWFNPIRLDLRHKIFRPNNRLCSLTTLTPLTSLTPVYLLPYSPFAIAVQAAQVDFYTKLPCTAPASGINHPRLKPWAIKMQPLRGCRSIILCAAIYGGEKHFVPAGCGTLLPLKMRHTIVCLYILFNPFNPLIHQWPDLRFAKTSFNFIYLPLTYSNFRITPVYLLPYSPFAIAVQAAQVDFLTELPCTARAGGINHPRLKPWAIKMQPLRGCRSIILCAAIYGGEKHFVPAGCGTLLPLKMRHTIVCLYILFNSFNPLIHQWPDLRFAKTSFNFIYLPLTYSNFF